MNVTSPIVITKQKSLKLIDKLFETEFEIETQNDDCDSDEKILDTRYLSFLKLNIFDLLNSEIIVYDKNNEITNKKTVIKVNKTYCNKVCISGIIVKIYENDKHFRVKIDDSTGCINVTLWKNLIYNKNDSKLYNMTDDSNLNRFYSLLNSIKSKSNEKSINHKINYEPKQGDTVMINAIVKDYKQQIILSATSCVRILNSTEEIFNIAFPSILNNKVYSIPTPSFNEFNKISTENEKILINKQNLNNQTKLNCNSNNKDHYLSNIKCVENFLSLVHRTLIKLTNNMQNQTSHITSKSVSYSCDSYSIYNYIRQNSSSEYKFIEHKQVLKALRELEETGLIYSCEDEFHYASL